MDANISIASLAQFPPVTGLQLEDRKNTLSEPLERMGLPTIPPMAKCSSKTRSRLGGSDSTGFSRLPVPLTMIESPIHESEVTARTEDSVARTAAVYMNQMEQIDEFFGARPRNKMTTLSSWESKRESATRISKAAEREPSTLARRLFWHGLWLFPLWFWGGALLVFPQTTPVDEDKALFRGQACLQPTLRDIEVKWAKRCLKALVTLVVVAIMAIVLGLSLLHHLG